MAAGPAASEPPFELLVFDEFLYECLEFTHMHPGSRLTLNHPEGHACRTPHGGLECFTGAILKTEGRIYVIGEYEPKSHSWWARWPD